MQQYKTAPGAVCDLILRGYSIDFSTGLVDEPPTVSCNSTRLWGEDFHVDEIHRFADRNGSSREIIVFAVSSQRQDKKGILVNLYSMESEDKILLQA